ncbi:hypothetical protein HRI_001280700 [Hibiscus trionum]|uniref:Endonuclease/exonuclease/phosphatase domain-containing protein n=1 Tax=Hibiscus trionum TaxID=183268 RepID=A0A9W7LT13_HIBTR|nr:hypothetical protein HRI_001280700 [Hibiscus trionum]
MKILVWNCQGLGNPGIVQFLKQLVASKSPSVVFLCDTRLNKRKAEDVRRRVNMSGNLVVEINEEGLGLMLLWTEVTQVSLLSYSKSHIDVEVSKDGVCFRFTGMYGTFHRSKKKEDWDLLDVLRTMSELPWLIGGDLNDILDLSEKEGGRRKPRVEMEEFNDAFLRNGLWDIKPDSGWFTWHSGINVENLVKERLDRFVASIAWIQLHGRGQVQSIHSSFSDHHYLLLDTEPCTGRGKRLVDQFRFENCWADEEACLETVKECWNDANSSTMNKLKAIGDKLYGWQKHKRALAMKRKNFLLEKIEKLLNETISEESARDLTASKKELKLLMDREEIVKPMFDFDITRSLRIKLKNLKLFVQIP